MMRWVRQELAATTLGSSREKPTAAFVVDCVGDVLGSLLHLLRLAVDELSMAISLSRPAALRSHPNRQTLPLQAIAGALLLDTAPARRPPRLNDPIITTQSAPS